MVINKKGNIQGSNLNIAKRMNDNKTDNYIIDTVFEKSNKNFENLKRYEEYKIEALNFMMDKILK